MMTPSSILSLFNYTFEKQNKGVVRGGSLDLLQGHLFIAGHSLESLRLFGETLLPDNSMPSAEKNSQTPTPTQVTPDFISSLHYMFPETTPFGIKPKSHLKPQKQAQAAVPPQNTEEITNTAQPPHTASLYEYLSNCSKETNGTGISVDSLSDLETCKAYIASNSKNHLVVLARLIATPTDTAALGDLPEYFLRVMATPSTSKVDFMDGAYLLARETLLSAFLFCYLKNREEYLTLVVCVYTLCAGQPMEENLFTSLPKIPAHAMSAYKSLTAVRARPGPSPFCRATSINEFIGQEHLRVPICADLLPEAHIHFVALLLTSNLVYYRDYPLSLINKIKNPAVCEFFTELQTTHRITLEQWERWRVLIRNLYPVTISKEDLKEPCKAAYHLIMILQLFIGHEICPYNSEYRLKNETAFLFNQAVKTLCPPAVVQISQDSSIGASDSSNDHSQCNIMFDIKHSLQVAFNEVKRRIEVVINANNIHVYPLNGHLSISNQFLQPCTTLPLHTRENACYAMLAHVLRSHVQTVQCLEKDRPTPLDYIISGVFARPGRTNDLLADILKDGNEQPRAFLVAVLRHILTASFSVAARDCRAVMKIPDILFEVLPSVPPAAIYVWLYVRELSTGEKRALVSDTYDRLTKDWADAQGTAYRSLMGLSEVHCEVPSPVNSVEEISDPLSSKEVASSVSNLEMVPSTPTHRKTNSLKYANEIRNYKTFAWNSYFQHLSSFNDIKRIVKALDSVNIVDYLLIQHTNKKLSTSMNSVLISDSILTEIRKRYNVISYRMQVSALFSILSKTYIMNSMFLSWITADCLKFVRPFLILASRISERDIFYRNDVWARTLLRVIRTLIELEERILQGEDGSLRCNLNLTAQKMAHRIISAESKHFSERSKNKPQAGAAQALPAGHQLFEEAARPVSRVIASLNKEKAEWSSKMAQIRKDIFESRRLFDKRLCLFILYEIRKSVDDNMFSPEAKAECLNILAALFPSLRHFILSEITESSLQAICREYKKSVIEVHAWLYNSDVYRAQ